MLIIHGLTGGIGQGLYLQAMRAKYVPTFVTERVDMQIDDPESVRKFYENIPGIDPAPDDPLYVINATGTCENSFLAKITDYQYDRQCGVLLDGNFYLAREFAKATKNRPGSSLLLLSSVVKRRAVPGTVVYAMCKAALDGLVKTAAAELGRYGNRINAIEMGYFNTGMINLVPDEYLEQLKKESPAGRLGEVEQLWSIAWEVLRNSFVTGATVPVTGGL